MVCHQHSVDDFQLQIEMCSLELSSMFGDNDEDMAPYQVKQMEELEGKKLKLMAGKRFHTNAKNAYWYYGIKADK
jgi:hypothetical protein|tara:strand:- start:309 stop:533 length:225 start_codon:yes stop_codon:yes gene_type:complete